MKRKRYTSKPRVLVGLLSVLSFGKEPEPQNLATTSGRDVESRRFSKEAESQER